MTATEHNRIEAVYGDREVAYEAGKYSPAIPGELYMLQRREEETLRALRASGLTDLAPLTILDAGCGRGLRLLDWLRWGADPMRLHGIDLVSRYVEAAGRLLPQAHICQAGADKLPFEDGTFDIVVQSMLMTSVLDEELRAAIAAELMRVLKPSGVLLWYDFRYAHPSNRDVRAIGRAEIERLFATCPISTRSLTLLPPLARALAPWSFTLCRVLERTAPPLRCIQRERSCHRGGRDNEATEILCDVIARLHVPRPRPLPELVPLSVWFEALEPAARTHGGILLKSHEASQQLSDPRDVVALHGDIHHENVLDFAPCGWLAIDPKRLVGERGFDYANIFCNPDVEDPSLGIAVDPERFASRLDIVVRRSGIPRERMLLWILAWAGLSATWFMPDGQTPEVDLRIAEMATAALGV